ncbi:MAG: Ig-like domain-containing protein [Lachnospiraceae bacterium]|nr:Ig-like domain-containing protein [Lachnospiraceae bacterium]
MERQTSIHIRRLFLFTVFILCFFICDMTAEAAFQSIGITNNEQKFIDIFVGDTGTILPQNIEDTSIERYEYSLDEYQNVLILDANGSFSAIGPGTATVYITGFTLNGELVYSSQITFTVQYDMNQVTLMKDNLQGYLIPTYFENKAYYDSYASFEVGVNSPFRIDTDDYHGSFILGCNSSNPNFTVDAYISNNVLYIDAYSEIGGSTILTLTLNGKTFLININLSKIGISNQSYLLIKKNKKRLRITGYSGPVTWTSTNPKIASVSSNGVIKGKKIGNTMIIAKVGDNYLGCAVSVTTAKIKKVVTRATYIGTHWKYSQEKRTQSGYYDCSALVWKAYKQYGKINFGSPNYPSVALSEAKWCKAHGRMLKGGLTSKKVARLQVNPGDLLFKSTNMKKKYQDIYHVEMFTGYYCNSVDTNGIVHFSITWASRGSTYGWEEGSLLGRPLK